MVYLKQDEVNGKRAKKPKSGKAEDRRSHFHTPEEMEAARSSKPEKEQRPRTGGPEKYGACYWCVKTDLSEDGEIYVFADDLRLTPTGGVLFISRDGDAEAARLALAPGQWTAVYAASCLDGSAVAVQHWKGEVAR